MGKGKDLDRIPFNEKEMTVKGYFPLDVKTESENSAALSALFLTL